MDKKYNKTTKQGIKEIIHQWIEQDRIISYIVVFLGEKNILTKNTWLIIFWIYRFVIIYKLINIKYFYIFDKIVIHFKHIRKILEKLDKYHLFNLIFRKKIYFLSLLHRIP